MKLKKMWMPGVFVFVFHMKNFMINIFSFWECFVFHSGGKNTITALLSFLSFFYWLDAEGYGSTVLPC